MGDTTRLSAREIYDYARGAGFSPDQAATMTAIALAESGGETGAHNPRGEDSRGLWQINVQAHRHLEDADLADPRVNAAAAFEVSRGGRDISPWTVTHGGSSASYLRFRDEAQAAAEAAGDGPGLGVWDGVTGYGDRTPAGEAEPAVAEAAATAADQEASEDEDDPLETFLESALAQTGDTYRFGAETRLDDPDPDAWDCSELVQWAAHQAGVTIPDGAIYQYRHLAKEGTTMSVEEALQTPGALLFRFSQDPSAPGRPASAHVAISLGDGRTIEARGQAYGVGSWEADESRFQYAGFVPAFGSEPLVEEPAEADEQPPADASLDELRELAETYSTAAQTLHDDSIATLERSESTELVDALYERGGLQAQLKGLPGHRAGYEERVAWKRGQADELNAESTRLEELGRVVEAEEKLEEALRMDASARLDQSRVDALDRREQELRERLEQVQQRIAEGEGQEARVLAEVADLERDADALDDARRGVLEAVRLREEAGRLHTEAARAAEGGDAARAAELQKKAEEATLRSDHALLHARGTVPDTDRVEAALAEAEELNRLSVVEVGTETGAAAAMAEPEMPHDDLVALRADFDRASEMLHSEALEALREGGRVQVQEQNVHWDRAQALEAEQEYGWAEMSRAAKAADAREAQAARLREEAERLTEAGDHVQAQEKLEEADRVEVLKEISVEAIVRYVDRSRELTQQHNEAVEAATAARKAALGHAARESELERTADHLDDATRLLDAALAARTEAQRLALEATQAGAAGDAQRAEQLRTQASAQVTRSDALVREAQAAVAGNAAAAAAVVEAREADPGEIIEEPTEDGTRDLDRDLGEDLDRHDDLDLDDDLAGVPGPTGDLEDAEPVDADPLGEVPVPEPRLPQEQEEDLVPQEAPASELDEHDTAPAFDEPAPVPEPVLTEPLPPPAQSAEPEPVPALDEGPGELE